VGRARAKKLAAPAKRVVVASPPKLARLVVRMFVAVSGTFTTTCHGRDFGVTNTYNRNGTTYNTYLTSGAWINNQVNALTDWTSIEKAELLIEAFKQIKTDKKLVVVGDAPYSEEYKQSLREAVDERVVFAGYVFADDYAAISRSASLFCLPSGIDGTRPVLLDQMGFGSCIVIRNSAANLEVGGEAVAVFDKDREIESLAETIARLIENPEERRRLGLAARERVASLYDWEVITTSYEKMFRKLAGK
jgi:glycosyltransferase involved in cell wall biosynthesis